MIGTQNKFTVFVPIEFEKSSKTGEQRYDNMRIKGVASNPNTGKDKQGQWLDPAGFDLNDFLKSGNLNYHHLWKKNPLAIVGEPTAARITKANELYIEGVLYKDSSTAREIYDLGEILEKNSKTRRLGFSIEGIPLEVDPTDENKITKARITNVAITPNPVNYGTRMDLIKGGVEGIDFERDNDDFLIDVIQDGIRYTVDKNLNIEKSETAGYGGESGSASSAEEMDRVTTRESVEHGKLPKKKRKKKIDEDKKDFSKGEIVLKIFSLFKGIDKDSVLRIANLSQEIQKSLTPNMEQVTKVTEDAYKIALQTLGLQKAETTTTPTQAEIQKAEADKLQSDYNEILKKADELKAKIEGKIVIEKAQVTEIKNQGDFAEIVKGLEGKIGALGTLMTLEKQGRDEIMKAQGEIKEELGKVTAFNTKISERLKLVEAQPMARKSVTGIGFIEKGEGAAEVSKNEGLRTLDLSDKRDRAVLADLAFNEATKEPGKVNKEFEKAVSSIELSSLGSNKVEQLRLQDWFMKEHKVKVVKTK